MDIIICPNLTKTKAGWLARSCALGLAGAGKSESEALDRLRGVVSAYCKGLAKDDLLLQALRSRGLDSAGLASGTWSCRPLRSFATGYYTYDPMGNRLTKVNNTVTTNYANDDADQMTAAGGVTYGYDHNGNQTSRGTDTFGYNAENRRTSTNLGGTSGSYAYNGDGLRTSRTIGGTTTTFAWDNDPTGKPVVLRDSAANKYLYGLDLISVTDTGNHQFYFHTDGLGSTTAITNSSGTVVKTYQYDVFGAIRVQTGTQPNEFTFTGEQVDSSGLQYLRVRYYDNATGRFMTRDPLPLPTDA